VPFVDTVAQEPPLPPMLAFVKGPAWDRATEETKAAFAELAGALGHGQCRQWWSCRSRSG
jgi:hypothetical protein